MGKITRSELRDALANKALLLVVGSVSDDALINGIQVALRPFWVWYSDIVAYSRWRRAAIPYLGSLYEA